MNFINPETNLVGAVKQLQQMMQGKPVAEPKPKLVKKEKIQFPPSLDNHLFLVAWTEWMQFRIDIKKKMTPLTMNKQLKMLSKHPVTVAISTIERSIQNGWTGLFPEKETNERNTIQTSKRKHEDFSNQKSSFGVSFSNAT